jgi:hypothetical protein
VYSVAGGQGKNAFTGVLVDFPVVSYPDCAATKALPGALSTLADKQRKGIAMKSSNEPRLQLLLLSKDLAHMQRMTAMLHANGIHTISELTSRPWRSAGLESLVMVSTEDYTKASALCLNREMDCCLYRPFTSCYPRGR